MNDEAADPLTRTVSLSTSRVPTELAPVEDPSEAAVSPLASEVISRASVVINTYNRAVYLRNAIRSILKQSYPAIELIVVNGPSTDGTEDLLQGITDEGVMLKRARCASRNLSESRNIGIAQAAGDVVFFIDDDAVAHPDWVAQLMGAYVDPEVGGAGGFTVDHTGVSFQCRYTACDRYGNARFFNLIDPTQIFERLRGFYFPSLLGTNCSFRRSDLLAINGFDPAYAYFLDETDVCLRLFDRKRRIVTVPRAFVFHKYAPSDTRSVDKIPKSLLASATSKAYFVTKHAGQQRDATDSTFAAQAELQQYTRDLQFSNRWFLDHKKISADHYLRLDNDLQQGIVAGMSSGLAALRRNDSQAPATTVLDAQTSFLFTKRPTVEIGDRLRIYFVSQGYPPRDTSGIARWTHECAKSLSARGHEVHVLTRSTTTHHFVDYVDGIWVHGLVDELPDKVLVPPVDVPDSLARRAAAVYAEITRAEAIWGVDVVSAPIWDLEGLFCVRHLRKPVITSLHTTYLLALPSKSDWKERPEYRRNHVEKVIQGERWLLRNSQHILANSQEVVRAIDEAYRLQLGSDHKRVHLIPHGIEELPSQRWNRALGADQRSPRTDQVSVLFVGRIESRKGVDQLLAALLRLRPGVVNLHVRFAGSWPSETDSYGQQIKTLAKQVAAKRKDIRVEFTGYASEQALHEYYESADIFVAPSRFESFGLIVVEAMRSGCPVIATNIGGIREIVDSDTGFLVGVDDVESLSERLEILIADRMLRRTLGEGGRRKFEALFTAGRMAESLESYFRSMVKSEVRNDWR